MGQHPSVLVTGAGGQVGRALARLLPAARLATRDELDITNATALGHVLDGALAGIDTVVHLAAYTDVDGCETDSARAYSVNGEGTRLVAEAAAAAGARVIYLSTDYVFDGTKVGEYDEDDEPNPLSVYGATKLIGEDAVLESPDNLVVRTSWVFGEGRNFVRTIVGAGRGRDRLRVVDDQRGRPTPAIDLAAALEFLLRERVSGIVHVAGDGAACTWAELAELSIAGAGLGATVERIDSATYAALTDKVVAPRPPDSTLSLERARQLGVPLRDWRPSLSEYLSEYLGGQ